METIKKYTLEQLKAVKPILSEKEQLCFMAGRIEQGGYYFFTREEMLEMFENEIMFPSLFETKLFEDTEESTDNHIVYIRYWFISISDYEKWLNSSYSFSTPQGGGSKVGSGSGSHNIELTEEEIEIHAASIASTLCETFYSFVKEEAKKNSFSVMERETFFNQYLPSIQSVVKNILKSGKTNIDARYISYTDLHIVSIKITNNYGISKEIKYYFLK